MAIEFVKLEAARAARGVRLVVLGGVPSPWSEAAKGILHVKGIDALAVRYRVDNDSVRTWTGVQNAPVLMVDDEAPRSHWADILGRLERLDSRVPLVPQARDARLRLWGLAHEILGDGGLLWSGRLLMVHDSLTSGGERGFPVPVSQFLATRYGYDAARVPAARERCREVLELMLEAAREGRARGSRYLIGDALTAADIYAAVALAPFAPLEEALCPMIPMVRSAFDSLDRTSTPPVPAELLEHRAFVYERHLELPVRL
jgi:glutathione S-transferase